MKREKNRKKWRIHASKIYVFIFLCIVSLSLLFFSARGFMVDAMNVGLSMYSGIRSSIFEVRRFVVNTVYSIQELATLREQHDALAVRVVRYEQLEQTAAIMRRENERLREQLGFAMTISHRYVAAEVIGTNPGNLFSALVINKGSRDGVVINMPVIAYQRNIGSRVFDATPAGTVLVGRIVQTGWSESLVMPIFDATSFVSARLAESRIEGLLEGQGSPNAPLLLRFVRHGQVREEIALGEQVFTSGLGGVFPAGILIGRVSRVVYQDTDISIEIELEISVDFSRLEYVFALDTRPETEEEA